MGHAHCSCLNPRTVSCHASPTPPRAYSTSQQAAGAIANGASSTSYRFGIVFNAPAPHTLSFFPVSFWPYAPLLQPFVFGQYIHRLTYDTVGTLSEDPGDAKVLAEGGWVGGWRVSGAE